MDGMVNGMGYGSSLETGGFVIVLIFAVVSFLAILFTLLVNIKIFTKAGKPWWACLIPIYNIIVYMDIAQIKYTNLLFLLIPFVGILIFTFKLCIALAKRFNKGIGFGIGMVFLPIIFLPILAFSKDEVNVVNEQVVQNVQNSDSNIETLDTEINFSNYSQANANSDNSLNSVQLENMKTDNNVNNDFQINSLVQTTNGIVSNNVQTGINNIESVEIDVLNSNIINNVDQVKNQDESVISNTINDNNSNIELLNNINSFGDMPVNNISSNFEQIDINKINSMNETTDLNVEGNNIELFNSVDVNNLEQNNELNSSTTNDTIIELETLNINNDTNNFNVVNKAKMCKNCAAEMPSIVTICPKCGTDNE